MNHLQTIILLLAKLLLVFYFLKAGVNNTRSFKKLVNVLKSKRIPFPHLIMIAVIAVQIFGSLAVVFNYYLVPSAIALILFTMAANLFFCNYWVMQGLDRRNISFLFYANIAVIGGLMMVIAQSLTVKI